MKTILGIGAHYDDCVFGISGLLLKALRQHHRVVVLSLIGDYRNWKPVQGRERELVDGTVRLGKEYGVEMRFLDFAEMKFDVTEAATRLVADAVADIAPDVAFTLWPHDQHPDHERASGLAKVALGFGDRLIDSRQALQAARAGLPVRQRPSPHARLRAQHVCGRHRRVAAGDRVAGQADGA